ncbi:MULTISPECIES: DUF5018 domain-containing protein [Tenacibaculum]|uniref:DUF5018 domain-containing protein n=1 Tax=Tenacibaculum TaxID=104267 RepID=UPI0009E6446E|nr:MULTISPECIES: DUF5018 domain-containing protein [Tenacibaculum]MCO7184006.1 DUF5018 domain-containing protein [Tenacibaculum sp. XPcli2-G]
MKRNTALFFLITVLIVTLSCNKEYILINNYISSNENEILSFSIKKGNFIKNFEISEDSIIGLIPDYVELDDVELEVFISEKSTINPDPKSITKINKPLTFTVTAENGTTKTYTIDIKRELSDQNDIISFKIKTTNQTLATSIDNIENKITKKLPTFLNLSNLTTEINISEKASISPLPSDIIDYSSPVNFTVKAENGVEKTYTVILEHVSNSFSNTCNQSNANKWFGGDSRTNAPDISPYDRNLGTGQSVLFQNDTELSSFSVKLESNFKHHETGTPHNKTIKLNLDIRNIRGEIVSTAITELDSTFLGGWVDFNLSDLQLFFEANTEYIFTWYLIDGANLGVNTGSSAYINSGNGLCFGQGYSGQSNISLNNNLKNWNTWIKHEWYFNIKLQGKQ